MLLRSQQLLHDLAGDVLRRVTSALEEAGVSVLPVKGIVTAHTLYADPGERPIADIDLRVMPHRLAEARAIVARAGWKVRESSVPYRYVVFHLSGVMVDVETAVGPPGLCDLRVADMLDRSAWVDHPMGFRVRHPEVHDHAVFLCVNAFKDKLVQAAPWAIEDLLRILRSPGLAPEALIVRARDAHALGILWIVADWLDRVHAASDWARLRDRIGVPPRRAYTWAFERLVRRAPRSFGLRLLARAGNDDPFSWPASLVRAARWQAEIGWRRS